MLTNIWSISLLVCSLAVIFLMVRSFVTAIKILRWWENGADTVRQIKLENESLLVAVLVQGGLTIQILSLLLLVIAADEFSDVLAGAMCATGAFAANDFGFPSLVIKLSSVFLYAFWIVIHRFDMHSKYYSLTRIKYIYLLFLFPIIFVDLYFQSLYLYNLNPDIITSCCGVIFNVSDQDAMLFGEIPLSLSSLLAPYYGLALLLLILQSNLFIRMKISKEYSLWWQGSVALGWLLFFPFSLFIITIVISSYIYALPSHQCPFDILKKEYAFIGYPIYFFLMGGTFFGVSLGVSALFSKYRELNKILSQHNYIALITAVCGLILYLCIISYPPLIYYFAGGEVGF